MVSKGEQELRDLLGLGPETELDLSEPLSGSELIDSYTFYEICSALLSRGQISSPRELEHCKTLGQLISLLDDEKPRA